MAIRDPWYLELNERYGAEYCRIAGYFAEDKPFNTPYADVFDLPKERPVLQFSGAFHPFHEGHLEIIEQALNGISCVDFAWDWVEPALVIIHVDHADYRNSKGRYDDHMKPLHALLRKAPFESMVVEEDKMPDGCSRNFTRLYQELVDHKNNVYFLCGGDRANYALTFRDKGKCVVVGRDQSPMYKKYSYLHGCGDIIFFEGNNPASSTEIRNAA